MNWDRLPAFSWLLEMLEENIVLAQVGFLTLVFALLICCLIACILAIKAAASARRAKGLAETHFRMSQDLAVEIRCLTAQIEKSKGHRPAFYPASPIRVAASETTDEAAVEIASSVSDRETSKSAEDENWTDSEGSLNAAKKAASEPSALLKGYTRRRH